MITLPSLAPDELSRFLHDPSKDGAGFGALHTSRGALPLVALEVNARLDGLVGGVEVRQTFVNSHDEPLEATYIFPLPDRAAVTRFRLEVAGRVVEGDLRERSKARREYDQAIQAGHRAAIAEEERAGVFTLRVGNLPPGERAVVQLSLVGPLPCSDGEVTFRFPLVVAPRYIPGSPLPGPAAGQGTASDTDETPDASRISPPVLLPGFPSPVRLRLSVEVPASPLEAHEFRSSLHTVVEEESPAGRRFRVQPGERLDRDFVLRYRIAASRVSTALVVRPDQDGKEGTFLLTLIPPVVAVSKVRPRAVVFVLDRSGSMSGWKMVAARRAVARMVETLTEDDRFSVYAFDDRIDTPGGFDGLALVPGSDRQRFRATEFLAGIDARGGTEMEQPLVKAAEELARAGGPGDDRVLVLITDGQVGNEDRILSQLGSKVQHLRIFTLGIDRAVNAGFLRRLADLGGGASEVVESEARLDEVMESVHRQIGTPILTGLDLQADGLEIDCESVVPARLPDLFARVPVVIAGRFRGRCDGTVRLRAEGVDGQPWLAEARAYRDERAPLASVWARGRVRDLEDRYAVGGGDRAKMEHEIVETSLRFGVLSRFTAFVAVDRSDIANPGGQQRQVTQAVESPAAWGLPDDRSPAPGYGAAPGAMRSPSTHTNSARRLSAPRAAESLDRLCEAGNTTTDFDVEFNSASPRKCLSGSGGGGLIDRLLSTFWGKVSKDATRSAPAAPQPVTDRASLRIMAEDVLRKLIAARARPTLVALRKTLSDLTALIDLLRGAGESGAAFVRLEHAAASFGKLLGQASPDFAAVEAQLAETTAALEAWTKPAGPDPKSTSAGQREGFWK